MNKENVIKQVSDSEYMEVRTQEGLEKIQLNKVLYFMSNVRIVEAHMENGKIIQFYGKLDDLQDSLQESSFLRCHKSFLVSKRQITKMTREYLLVGNEQIPVSRTYYVKMREQGLIGKKHAKIKVVEDKDPSYKGESPGKIRCINGKFKGMVLQIYPNEKIVFGRSYEEADLVFDEMEISREHCWIQYNDKINGYFICNCSTNGLFINNRYVTEKNHIISLKQGDKIQLSETDNVFEIG
ncbi:MAG: LytTR family transcriptional regulator DNA-binding domain-containing protein [Lachnospiraceae bacterium]